jgi:peptidoglycan/LPS O-acetylase OafA/YrhL
MQQAGAPLERKWYRADIEGLRGLAVSLVVLYHSTPRRFPGGFTGVDVFFVISGFLITGLLLRERQETGDISLAGFYARRARRLLPASAVMFLGTLLACAVFLSPLQQYHLRDSMVHTALYIGNFWFLRRSDYFSPDIGRNPFLHTWSLAVEEQFYLVWPLLVALCFRGLRSRRNLGMAVAAITGVSLALSVWFAKVYAPWGFFSPVSRAWEFAIGAMACVAAPWAMRVPAGVRASASWCGLAALVGPGFLLQGAGGWPGWRALLPVLATSAILLGTAPGIGASRLLELPVSQWLGQRSYSWYLWHWPVLTISTAMHPGYTLRQHVYEAAACAAGSLALAAATHAWIENPIRFSRYLAPRRALTLAGVAMVTLAAAGAALLFEGHAAQTARTLEGGQILAESRSDADAEQCPAVPFTGADVIECIGGDRGSGVLMVLFGDSHARQWFPAFDAIARERGWRLILLYKPACPSARVTVFQMQLNRVYTECDAWREAAIERILALRPALVVVTNRQIRNYAVAQAGPDRWREGNRYILGRFDAAKIRTILLRDTPLPGTDIPTCLAGDTSVWAKITSQGKNLCLTERAQAFDEEVFRQEQQAAQGLAHVSTLDLTDLFCDGAVCPPVKDGTLVYSDESHISKRFAKNLAPAIDGRIF